MSEREAPPSPADFAAAGLYDPDGPGAEARLELLELLAAEGATVAEMVESSDRLPAMVTHLGDAHRQRYSAEEVARRAAVPVETVVELWRAAGFADPGDQKRFSETDLVAFGLFAAGEAVLGREATLQFTRVLGSAAGRVAEAAMTQLVVAVGRPALEHDPDGLELARTNLQVMQLLPAVETTFGVLLRHHLRATLRSVEEVRSLGPGYETLALTVGFIDLVDSTGMSRSLAPTELGDALAEFEAIVGDLVASHGGRLVKLIGDEAMYVARSPSAACRIALEAAAALDDHASLPPARAALAHGELVLREGDYFGPVVNLAARLVKLSDPSGVVIDAGLAEQVRGDPGLAQGVLESRMVKGFDRPVEFATIRLSGS